MIDKIKRFFNRFSIIPRINYCLYYVIKDERFYRWPIISLAIKTICEHNKNSVSKYCDTIVNERIVELPFVLDAIKKRGAKILDVGCDESILSLHLASFGHQVTALDLNNYEFRHPNLEFIKGDIIKVDLAKESFDYIIFLSVLEHVGLGVYGEDGFGGGDKRAVDQAFKLLKPDGRLIVTVPFGKGEIGKTQRIYDPASITDLFHDFETESEEYYLGLGQKHWLRVSQNELNNVASKIFTQGAGLFCLKKK